jgi:archaellum component FlaC
LDELEENVTNIPVIPGDLNHCWNGIKNDVTTTKTDLERMKIYVEGLGTPPSDLYSKLGEIKDDVLNCKNDIRSLKESVEALQKTIADSSTPSK